MSIDSSTAARRAVCLLDQSHNLRQRGVCPDGGGAHDTVVFDKTGTLTRARMRVTDVIAGQRRQPNQVLRLAAAVESGSEHPIGAAIVAAAHERGLAIPAANAFTAVAGHGVRAQVNGGPVVVGRRKLVDEQHLVLPDHLAAAAVEQEERGRTAVFVGQDGQVVGVLAVADTVKDDAADVVGRLHAMGLQVAMITGDNARTAAAIAKQVGIVNHGLHFAMAVAMAVMAWPWGARVPTTGPAVFFLLAAVWFGATAVVAVRGTATRGLYGYHGLMMLATAWMYAAMNPRLLPVRSCTEYATEPDGSMPAMDMTAMNMPPNSGSPIWFSAVNWIGTVGFAVAAVFWACRFVMERRQEATQSRLPGSIGQAMMAAGMAMLFFAMLFPV